MPKVPRPSVNMKCVQVNLTRPSALAGGKDLNKQKNGTEMWAICILLPFPLIPAVLSTMNVVVKQWHKFICYEMFPQNCLMTSLANQSTFLRTRKKENDQSTYCLKKTAGGTIKVALLMAKQAQVTLLSRSW